jgi:DNA-binding MarR family transcriptional regulator
MAGKDSIERAGTRRRRKPRGGRGLATEPETGSALQPFDRLVHERMRLGILSALAVSSPLSFTELKTSLRTTDGNLSVHARRLEEAGYIRCTKRFEDRLPKTEFRLTDVGRQALESYLDRMEALIRFTRDR